MIDVAIIGSGAAGLTAALFAKRYGLSVALFGKSPGGQMKDAHIVENYPGIASIEGPELTQLMVQQVRASGVVLDERTVTALRSVEGEFEVIPESGDAVSARALVLAMGAKHRALNVPGEERFFGHGVYYSLPDDLSVWQGKRVAVIGGGDSAVTYALALSKIAEQVFLIHRRAEFRAEAKWLQELSECHNIRVIAPCGATGVQGEQAVSSLTLNQTVDGITDAEGRLGVEGVWVAIGQLPATHLAEQLGVAVQEGYLVRDAKTATNIPGVYAAGDLALEPGGIVFRQIVTSAGEGALAAAAVFQYLNGSLPAPDWS